MGLNAFYVALVQPMIQIVNYKLITSNLGAKVVRLLLRTSKHFVRIAIKEKVIYKMRTPDSASVPLVTSLVKARRLRQPRGI